MICQPNTSPHITPTPLLPSKLKEAFSAILLCLECKVRSGDSVCCESACIHIGLKRSNESAVLAGCLLMDGGFFLTRQTIHFIAQLDTVINKLLFWLGWIQSSQLEKLARILHRIQDRVIWFLLDQSNPFQISKLAFKFLNKRASFLNPRP